MGYLCIGQGGLVDDAVATGAVKRIRKGQSQRGRVGRLLLADGGDCEQGRAKANAKIAEVRVEAAHGFVAAVSAAYKRYRWLPK